MNTRVYCALAVLVCAMGAAAAEIPVASSDPLESALDFSHWTDFTTAWNRSHETEYTPRELRASLPGVTTADVAWVLAERDFNEQILVGTHWSPEDILLEEPPEGSFRLAGKFIGEVAWLGVLAASYATTRTPDPVWPAESTEEEEILWSSLEETLGDLASLRGNGTVPVKELLWFLIAQDLDERAWRETYLTADDLLSMPGYGLLRKIYADGMTEMMIASVLGTDLDDHCQKFPDTTMKVCEALAKSQTEGKTPYGEIYRSFEPEVVRDILRYPRHSKEPVDFIVALKSVEVDCDEELRQMLYPLFGIELDSCR